MISVEHCTYRHRHQQREEKSALDDVSFTVERGSLLCLAGANGGGKSTLLGILAGLLTPASGRVVVDGHASPGAEDDIRTVVALVLQEADLQVLGATVEEDLLLGSPPGDEEGATRARETAARLGISHLMERPVSALSHGEKRKLCIAAQLACGPKVLLLDEPFSGLDYHGILEMRAILAANREAGLTQIASTHDLEPLADLADSLAVLRHGRLALHGPVEEQLDRLAELGVRPPCSWTSGRRLGPWR
ncbi:energy-coupling factor ABC transporter ATP-binding protein [Oceanidesulfovibrio marinus]|uniref:ABC transporter ATP-binding protein n=1 Tax=Oceanidesulfovibrio marinus TaxID=370038 RepID=A0ABX6NEP4_9BACT|nr:ABC transporter ATP-binding protein [Oceanidesulfovibrio marinus]QJT09037.1 ABC transporter ATP-binding protein [Oceanidesulfovibrio marinus]